MEFKLLGITFESRVLNLYSHFEIKILKVQYLIEKWKRKNLTLNGWVEIAQAIVLLEIMNTNTSDICRQVQKMMEENISGDTNRTWMAEYYMYTKKSLGGLHFINIVTFMNAQKIFWTK